MDNRIKKVLNYIEDNLSLSADLSELAAIACLSPSQFHRVFKKETNYTPFQFIEKISGFIFFNWQKCGVFRFEVAFSRLNGSL